MAGNRQIIFLRRPKGAIQDEDFETRDGDVPEPKVGEVLVKNLYLSLDAASRVWMNETPSYKAPVKVGGVMDGLTISRVVKSNHPGFSEGRLVECMGGWQEYAVLPAGRLVPLADRKPISHHLSVFGVAGLTAYFGLLDVGRPKPGETVLVSGAAGSVGSIAGQIAKISRCRVVGIAGSDAKCDWLRDELGFDDAINYKNEDVVSQLAETCPKGVDVFFDNVGGSVLETVLRAMNRYGRIVCCGSISDYNATSAPAGPRGVPGLLIVRRLRMEGFVVIDYMRRRPEADAQLAHWFREGRLKVREDIVDGLENALPALKGLFAGKNTGKLMIRIAD